MGIVCANYASGRGLWGPCQKMWCGGCYSTHPLDPYPVKRSRDEARALQVDDKDVDRFQVGRNGDHLMMAFQCDLCHFRNMKKRDPRQEHYPDESLLLNIRRANLDIMWSREPSTVAQNRNQYERAARIAQGLEVDEELFGPMGPFPI